MINDMIKINLVQSTENTNLFEAVLPGDGLVRRMLPARVKSPTEEEFVAGIEYGLDFSELVKSAGNFAEFPDNLQTQLHNAGIWTGEDLKSHGREAVGALQAAYGIELSSLIRLADEKENKQAKTISKVPKGSKKSVK